MTPDITLLVLLAAPVAILVVLKVNAALVFLSACLGAVLLRFIGDEAARFAELFLPFLNGDNLKLAIMLLPVILSVIFLRGTVRGGRHFTNILPVIGTAFLLVLLGVPLLPADLANSVTASFAWEKLSQFQTLVIAVSALVSLLFIWSQHRKPSSKHSKH